MKAMAKTRRQPGVDMHDTGKVNVAPIIAHRLGLAEGRRGFETCVSREAARVIFTA